LNTAAVMAFNRLIRDSAFMRMVRILCVLLGLGLAGWALLQTDALSFLADEERLRASIQSLGIWGPLIVVLLRAGAVLTAFLPNSPISLASGAAYGPLWGTVYVLIGSELGAVLAFMIARRLGFDAVRRRGWIDRIRQSRWGNWLFRRGHSQNRLSAAVFLARAVPFVNLDMVSYVAGVTRLRFWRYALASFAGLAPYNFAFAYLGDKLVGANKTTVALILLLTALLTVLPLALKPLWSRFRKDAPPA
jgi:uncharacterized membrane protein YdjX (TVP38/TMEM64 family)